MIRAKKELVINILVFGAGAIGCLVGGALSQAGHQVTLLGRAYLAQAVEKQGLKILWPDKEAMLVHPQVVETLDAFDQFADLDIVIISVKSYATQTAVQALAPYLQARTRVLSLQNGVGNETILRQYLPQQKLIAGSITISVERPDLAVIRIAKNKGGIGLAAISPNCPLHDVQEAFQAAGFVCRQYDTVDSLKWSKLIMNLTCNALAAILALPPSQILADKSLYDLELAALREAFTVMDAQSIKTVGLPSYPIPLLRYALRFLPNILLRPILRSIIAGGRGDKLPSLLLDLKQGRPHSEVVVLNLAVVAAAETQGIDVPVNRLIGETLESIVAGHLDWTRFKQAPDAFLEYAKAYLS